MDWDSANTLNFIRTALEEDIGPADITSLATIPAGATAKARILARAPLVCAGLPIVQRVFTILDPGVKLEFLAQDGDIVEKPRALVHITGRARPVLTGERTALNFLAHLSGIATLTDRFVEQLAGTRARMRDTRKTTPGMRVLEKYAVKMGGGTNHRIGLYDAILLKENHIALAGGIKEALDKAHCFVSTRIGSREMTAYEATNSAPASAKSGSIPVQIEVRDEKELREALGAGAESVLLDNMTPDAAALCVAIVRQIREDCIVEVSGGITLKNARAYAQTGADFLSAGALTHSAPAADLSLLVDSLAAN